MEYPFNTSGSVLCVGEILLRFLPDSQGDWLRNNQMAFSLGGAELNVATNLSLWHIQTKYFTAMPDNGLSFQILGFLEEKQIDISAVYRGGERLGIFYLSPGRDMKHQDLVYDRARSAFSELNTGMIHWEKVLDGVSWLHFSAISPGISQNAAYLCEEALIEASKLGITISVDLNYREKLWQYGALPDKIIPKLLPHCDLIMGNIWAIHKMAGLKSLPNISITATKEDYEELTRQFSQKLMKAYPKAKAVANTYRMEFNGAIRYYAHLVHEDHLFSSEEYHSAYYEDKVGSGDCFMAGLIYGFFEKYSFQEIIDFATAAAFDKLFIRGDATTSHPDQIKKRIK